MLTYQLFQLLKNHLEVLKIINTLRDILLFILIIISIILVINSSFKSRKFNRFVFLEIALSFILTFTITHLIKDNYPHVRPISYFYPGEQLFDSFPSAHTALAFAISNVILNNYLEWGIFLFLISLLIGLLSWFSLMHWPLDVITGAFLGFFISTIVLEITKILLRIYIKNSKQKF